jgi:hypothetical protein
MSSPTSVFELVRGLSSSLDSERRAALFEIDELLTQWSDSRRTGNPALLQDDAARDAILTSLVALIDRDPEHPTAATAIWVLGKLFDPSLEPYLAQLATRFLSDPRLSWHLRQTAIALDNLDRIPELRTLEDQDDIAALTRIVRDYLRAPR